MWSVDHVASLQFNTSCVWKISKIMARCSKHSGDGRVLRFRASQETIGGSEPWPKAMDDEKVNEVTRSRCWRPKPSLWFRVSSKNREYQPFENERRGYKLTALLHVHVECMKGFSTDFQYLSNNGLAIDKRKCKTLETGNVEETRGSKKE